MKKLISVCCAFGVLFSSALPIQAAADAAVQYDIAVYAKEHCRRSDGAALHFLDPTRWYAKEITKAPDFGNNEGIAYLYADDLGEKYLTGDWSGSLMIAIAYSLFNFDLCEVSEEDAAAFDAVMTEFAASRDTLVIIPHSGKQQFAGRKTSIHGKENTNSRKERSNSPKERTSCII